MPPPLNGPHVGYRYIFALSVTTIACPAASSREFGEGPGRRGWHGIAYGVRRSQYGVPRSQLLLSAGSEKTELSDIGPTQLLSNWRAQQPNASYSPSRRGHCVGGVNRSPLIGKSSCDSQPIATRALSNERSVVQIELPRACEKS